MSEAVEVAAAALIGAAVFSLIFGSAIVSGADLPVIVSVADDPLRWLSWPALYGGMAGAAWAIIRLQRR